MRTPPMKKRPVVVITGASAGVGRATVREFARRGAAIALIARGLDGLEGAQREVEAAGGEAMILQADVADDLRMEAAAAAAEARFGPIDIWINNAMCSVFSPVAEMEAAEYRRVTEVTYLGAVHGTLAALRRMRPRGSGVIIQVGSALAYRSIPLQSAYCAAKHALAGFTDSLRCELIAERSGVQVTMVDLPALNTPQFGWVKSRLKRQGQPVPPIYQPEVAARAIHHAAYHHRRQWFVGAPTVLAIFGNALIPGILDHYLGRTGFAAQQRDTPEDPQRPDNLYQPVPGDHGAHGAFDARARSFSLQVWLDMHLAWVLVAVGVLLCGVAGAVLLTRGWGRW